MFLNITPIIKTPFTDLVGNIGHHQYYGRCADFEMKMMNCFEAYGLERGKVKCKDIIDDFEECHLMTKQAHRIREMRMERHRQWLKGERSSAEHYESPPKVDSY